MKNTVFVFYINQFQVSISSVAFLYLSTAFNKAIMVSPTDSHTHRVNQIWINYIFLNCTHSKKWIKSNKKWSHINWLYKQRTRKNSYTFLGHNIMLKYDAEIGQRITLGYVALEKLSLILWSRIFLKQKMLNACIIPLLSYGMKTANFTRKTVTRLHRTQKE